MSDTAPVASSAPRLITAALLALIGLFLVGAGICLVWFGGSPYYLIAGVLVLAAGVLLWRANPWGERLYTVMLAGTLVWSIYEAGGNPWALTGRLFAPALLAIWLSMPWIRRDVIGRGKRSEALVVAILVLVVIAFRFFQFAPEPELKPTVVAPMQDHPPVTDSDWANYGLTPGGSRFSDLTQIDVGNVATLKLAWVYRSGFKPSQFEPSEATPLKVGDLLYTCTQHSQVIAIEATTGKERWRYDTGKTDFTGFKGRICRGVSYYQKPDALGACAGRVLIAAMDGKIHAVDALDGKPCADFGQGGEVSLYDGLGTVNPGDYSVTAPGVVVGNHIIFGAQVADNVQVDMPSGVIRSFDPVSGALQWAWDMGAPDRIGAPPEGETYTRGTPNAWAALAADEKLGLVYVPTGNPAPDFYGVLRRPFDEKYGSAIVALDINNGRERWSFQTTHHDVWDYDIPAQPVLVDVPEGDHMTPAIIQSTKRGELFVLDRRDGRPIVPVTERPVPQALPDSAVPGEKLSATQPFSGISLVPPPLKEADMWGATPLDMLICRIHFKNTRYEGPFTPIGTKPALSYPGSMGVVDWGGVVVDEDNNVLVVNTSDLPWRAWLTPREKETDKNPVWPQKGTPYVAHNWPFLGPLGIPCTQPPWGHLLAIDLKTKQILWRRVLGTARDSGPLRSSLGLPLPIGIMSQGGPIVTRGGLVFMAGTLDRYLRAFDIKTGKELWRARLPAGAHATPMTYMAGSKQYVVITAGGHWFLGTKQGDYTLAFTLP